MIEDYCEGYWQQLRVENNSSYQARDALILPAKFLEKYVGKSKEQNAGKIGGKLEK